MTDQISRREVKAAIEKRYLNCTITRDLANKLLADIDEIGVKPTAKEVAQRLVEQFRRNGQFDTRMP